MPDPTATRRFGRRATRDAAEARDASTSAPATASTTEQAVREVWIEHYGQLAGWTTHLVGDPDLAHDLATEAFVRLLRDFRKVDEPRPWLYTVVANLVRDHWRRAGRRDAAYHRFAAGAPEATELATGPAGGLDRATTLTVRDAVQQLPDRLRVTVLLHYFADLPVATVARELGKSEGTVKRDLFDARRRMAGMLEDVR